MLFRSRSREVGHFVGVVDVERRLGEVGNDRVTACVCRNGREIESSILRLCSLLLALLGHPSDSQTKAVLVGCEELVPSIDARVCFPLSSIDHADLSFSRSDTILFPTLADQCDDIAGFLVLLWLLAVVVLRSQHNKIVRTEAVFRSEDFCCRSSQSDAEVGGWNDFVCW